MILKMASDLKNDSGWPFENHQREKKEIIIDRSDSVTVLPGKKGDYLVIYASCVVYEWPTTKATQLPSMINGLLRFKTEIH